MNRDELIWKRVNGERLRQGRPMVSLAQVSRAARLMLGKACPDLCSVFTGRAFTGAKDARRCSGHDSLNGHVECAKSILPRGGRTRCYDCGGKQASFDDNVRRKQRRAEIRAEKAAKAPKPERVPKTPRSNTCPGYETRDGLVACGVDFGKRGCVKRCPTCTPLHKLWYDRLRNASIRTKPLNGHTAKLQLSSVRTDEPHRVTHWCDECAGLSERRPTEGLCLCGLPWKAEKIERGTALRSSIMSECRRNYGG